ncbi:MAG: FliH/SctL family protein [Armatimonadota bacterium]|nr:FliH/SctL family protein [Armatimonadota bacterium]
MSALIKRRTVTGAAGKGDYLVDCQRLAAARRKRAGEPPSVEDLTENILIQAREEASRLVAEAGEQADGIRAAAYEEGRRFAETDLAQIRLEMAQRLDELEAEAAAQVAQFWRDVEPELLQLAVEIAQRIVRREIEKNSDFMLDAIKAGLHQLSDRRQLKIRVNAAQSGFLREHKDDLLSGFDGISSVEIIEDRRISEGGWVVESANGRVDGKIESQLQEVERTLVEVCRDGQS